jgi:preprotein translocase subunit YajC
MEVTHNPMLSLLIILVIFAGVYLLIQKRKAKKSGEKLSDRLKDKYEDTFNKKK